MREQYPFFRDGDEQTRAVIGEEAVKADLEGDYQKPYAVLTQKRLYCKNEQGNFITDASALRSAGKGLLPGQNWFLWAVAACVGLTLVLLCLWWGMGGRWYTEEISYYAQMYIDDYHAFEEQVKGYEEQLDAYEEAQEKLEEYEKIWDDNGYEEIAREISERQAEVDSAQKKLDRATQQVSDAQTKIADNEKQIQTYQDSIERKQERYLEVVKEWNEEYRIYVEYYEMSWWMIEASESANKLEDLARERDQLFEDIDDMQSKRQLLQAEVTELQAKLPDYQGNVDEARVEVAAFKEKLAEYAEKNAEVEAVRENIAEQKGIQAGIDCDNLESEIQRFEDSKSDYKNAQSVQRKTKLFLPCLLAFAACVVVFIILTALKRAKLAVVMALVSACVGLVCAFLSNINLPNIQGFGWGYYYIMPPPLSIALRVLPILAVLLVVLALWWNRKKTVFEIVHNTGAFSFTPSVYPAEELKLFAEQVQLMREGEADGE